MSVFYSYRIVKVRSLSGFRSHQAPVRSNTDCHDIAANARVVEQMLLERNTALLVVGQQVDLAHPKLDVQVGYALVEDITGQTRLNQVFPDIFRIKMQVPAEAPGNYYPAREFGAKLRRNCQPSLVVKNSIEVVYRGHWCPLSY